MKRYYCILCIMTLTCALNAQNTIPVNGRPYIEIFDSISSGLIKNRIPHAVLYDRVFPWSSLDYWQNGDTLTSTKLKQAWWDLEKSNIDTAYNYRYQNLADTIDVYSLQNKILLPVIHYNFAVIDTNALNDGRLEIVNGILTDKNLSTPPYLEQQVTLTALSEDSFLTNTVYTVIFDTLWLLNNTTDKVASVIMTLDRNSFSLSPASSINFTIPNEGVYYLKFDIILMTSDTLSSMQRIIVSRKSSGALGSCNPEPHFIESYIPFQGYNESVATTTLGNYAIYYRYKTGSTTECEDKLNKPIIFLDGYDPRDERPISELFKIYLEYTDNGNIKNIANELRSQGYDIIVLNFPKVGSLEVNNNSYVRSYTGSTYNGTVNRVNRDGGTDYIERNAFLLVKLIQDVKNELIVNNSNEELVVVGPSMGGQISRYALAYMEKQFAATNDPIYDHKTRLWISFDSPHLGANIPLATQQALFFFADFGGLQSAKKALMFRIQTPAGKQQLIEQLDSRNHQATFRQAYINSLTSNGLAGSDGYPVNLRKVTLVNGSGKGILTAPPAAEYLGMKGKIIGKILLMELYTNYLNGYNYSVRTLKAGLSFSLNQTWWGVEMFTENINPNGSMDVMPGGTYNSHSEIVEEDNNYEWTTYRKDHTFIPTISALAFRNPNFNWANDVSNRNLLCNNEIYFDNYFAPKSNEPHIYLTQESANWVKEEIQKGALNCPTICSYSIEGSNWICPNNNYTYNFDISPPAGVTTTWSVSGGLSIVSSTNSTITVSSIVNFNNAWITAIINNPCGANSKITRLVKAGQLQPGITFSAINGDDCFQEAVAYPQDPNLIYEWSKNGTTFSVGGYTYGIFKVRSGANDPVWLRITNNCGSETVQTTFTIQNCNSYKKGNEISEYVYPNPTSTFWKIEFYNTETLEHNGLTIYDISGKLISVDHNFNDNKLEISAHNLSAGIYFLKIKVNDVYKNFKLIKL